VPDVVEIVVTSVDEVDSGVKAEKSDASTAKNENIFAVLIRPLCEQVTVLQ
jgi:hypothetical protein